jgi:hypothetical protein
LKLKISILDFRERIILTPILTISVLYTLMLLHLLEIGIYLYLFVIGFMFLFRIKSIFKGLIENKQMNIEFLKIFTVIILITTVGFNMDEYFNLKQNIHEDSWNLLLYSYVLLNENYLYSYPSGVPLLFTISPRILGQTELSVTNLIVIEFSYFIFLFNIFLASIFKRNSRYFLNLIFIIPLQNFPLEIILSYGTFAIFLIIFLNLIRRLTEIPLSAHKFSYYFIFFLYVYSMTIISPNNFIMNIIVLFISLFILNLNHFFDIFKLILITTLAFGAGILNVILNTNFLNWSINAASGKINEADENGVMGSAISATKDFVGVKYSRISSEYISFVNLGLFVNILILLVLYYLYSSKMSNVFRNLLVFVIFQSIFLIFGILEFRNYIGRNSYIIVLLSMLLYFYSTSFIKIHFQVNLCARRDLNP